MAIVREPVVAGRFYPSNAAQLSKDIASYLSPQADKVTAIGCIAPHAGYMYSGRVAGAVFSKIEIPSRCIVLGPNHTGCGHPLAITVHGSWRTPLGDLSVDQELATQLVDTFPAISEDSTAHRFEHSIEVEVPFLQKLRPELQFVPIAVGTGQLVIVEHLGKAIAHVVQAQSEPVLIIASSDMNHYEDDATTRVKDRKAIDQVLAMDPEGLYDIVHREKISMCGYGPAVAMLTAAKQLGATKAELVKYATSGDVSLDFDRVVGYAGMLVC